jgi:predicted MFS family arabinose efflux permease
MPPANGIEHRLDEIEEKVDESYKILKAVKRRQSIDFWFGVIKIMIFLGTFYYAYVFLEPYVEDVKNLYFSIEGLSSTKGFNIFEFIKDAQQQAQ